MSGFLPHLQRHALYKKPNSIVLSTKILGTPAAQSFGQDKETQVPASWCLPFPNDPFQLGRSRTIVGRIVVELSGTASNARDRQHTAARTSLGYVPVTRTMTELCLGNLNSRTAELDVRRSSTAG